MSENTEATPEAPAAKPTLLDLQRQYGDCKNADARREFFLAHPELAAVIDPVNHH